MRRLPSINCAQSLEVPQSDMLMAQSSWMKKALRLGLCGSILLALVTARKAEPSSAGRQAEDELIQMLGSPDSDKVKHAIDELLDCYPKSTNAIPVIRSLLKNKTVQRRAAYALGKYHAELEMDEVKIILGFLR